MRTFEFDLSKKIKATINHIDSRIEFKGGQQKALISLRAHALKCMNDVPGCNLNKEKRLIIERRLRLIKSLAIKFGR